MAIPTMEQLRAMNPGENGSGFHVDCAFHHGQMAALESIRQLVWAADLPAAAAALIHSMLFQVADEASADMAAIVGG